MISEIKKLAVTETGKDTIIVFWGTIINIILGGTFFILAPRFLGPANYGLFTAVYATSVFTVRLTSLGIDTGILRFTNKLSQQSNDFLSIAFKWYLILGLAAAIFGFIISSKLAQLLGQPQIATLLKIAFISTILFHITNLLTSALQAKREFIKASILLIANNTVRLILVFSLAYFFVVNLTSLTLIFFTSTLAAVAIGGYFMPIEITKINVDLQKKFFKFNFWVWLSLSLSAIPFDNYLLLKISGPVQAGLYAAPFKILNYAYQVGGNFTAVLASRFSSFDTAEKAKVYSKKTLIFPIIFSLAFVFVILFANIIVDVFFGKQFTGATQILRILSVGSIFFFIATIPSSIILYYFGKSSVSFTITVMKYMLFILLLLKLIPNQQAIGAAYAFSTSEGFALFAMTVYILVKFQMKDVN